MNISFFGLGYVGCVGMGCLAQNGHKVIGIDISSEKIKEEFYKLKYCSTVVYMVPRA